jgi:hypothetical protein
MKKGNSVIVIRTDLEDNTNSHNFGIMSQI